LAVVPEEVQLGYHYCDGTSRGWPNTLISPHLGGLNESYARELLPILQENMHCFLAGDLALLRNFVRR